MTRRPGQAHHVVWFRRDLRIEQNPAFDAATADADRVTAVFVLEPELLASAGPPRLALLLANLDALDHDLAALGGRLRVLEGPAATALAELRQHDPFDAVYLNQDTSPFARTRDEAVARAVGPLVGFWGTLFHPPGSVLTQKGTLSRVFTPFWKTWARTPAVEPPPAGTASITDNPGISVPAAATEAPIRPGNAGAHERLATFLDRVEQYPVDRDLPAEPGTSALSADLRFGTISTHTIHTHVGRETPAREAFVRQLAWRDWYSHLLFENPHMPNAAIRPEYDNIAWRDDPEGFQAWCDGQTGYPIVDAGMRQLAKTGWMHNRVRMITGSFLVKDLLVDWRKGERFFRRHLIDGEISQNAGNWQWVAGTGTDAAPYFRVFNPITQSRKFDKAGAYIRHWVPELAGLPDKHLHAPWEMPPLDLAASGVVLGQDYPAPMVDHAHARERVLATYKAALSSAD